MAKYIYHAIFHTEEGGALSVAFPDLEGCISQGDDLADAYAMAQDALCLTLYQMEEDGETIPKPSDIAALSPGKDAFASLVSCDTMEYRKYYENRSIKKTLTIPFWLNAMAEKAGINFSAVLQKALKNELQL